jgi:hypothetical protein
MLRIAVVPFQRRLERFNSIYMVGVRTESSRDSAAAPKRKSSPRRTRRSETFSVFKLRILRVLFGKLVQVAINAILGVISEAEPKNLLSTLYLKKQMLRFSSA